MGGSLELNRVLILDDEEPLLRLLARLVERSGGVPVLASSCTEARELISANRFACALLDKNLPDGSGLDLIPLLKESPGRPDVVIITAHAEMSSAIFALREGAADYLVKPFSTALVTHRLEQIFERRRLMEERTRMQSQLVRADRMAALGTLAAGVAHEIKNPLAFMALGLDSLEQELPRLKLITEALGRSHAVAGEVTQLQQGLGLIEKRLHPVRAGIDRMAKLAGDLRDYARGGHETPAEVDLREVVRVVAEMARPQVERKARLIVELGEVEKVSAVATRLEQVLLNLTVNAFQALPDAQAAHEIRIATRQDGDDALLEVKDTGEGIPSDVLPRIFDPFFTTKVAGEGTGLGLSISNEIVIGFGGRIEVESSAGTGALFRVRLPKAGAPKLAAPQRPAQVTLEKGARARILVVDDEPNVAQLLQEALGAEHDVIALTHAKTALQQLSGGTHYDLIVCDLVMPEMTGMELHQELTRISPRLANRMIFLTGAATTRSVQSFLSRVDNMYLEKPFQLQALREMISQLVTPPPLN